MSLSVALIDSGVNSGHPHIRDRQGSVRSWRVEGQTPSEFVAREVADVGDAVGHGTAAAAAILDLAPGIQVESIQIFEVGATTEFERVLCALDQALELEPDVCNLSLGTTRDLWNVQLEARIERFVERGIPLVAPVLWRGLPCYPGSLVGCAGVRVDASLERNRPELRSVGGRDDWFVSPFPRDLPGLPRESNLAGASMACANLSGVFLRRLMDAQVR